MAENQVTDQDINKLKRSKPSENELIIHQFNCNSISNKLTEIKMNLYANKPEIFCFCETFINKKEPKFVGYHAYWKHRVGHGGGLGVLVRNDLISRIKEIDPYEFSQLEYQCVQVYSGSYWIDIMNVYNPHKMSPLKKCFTIAITCLEIPLLWETLTLIHQFGMREVGLIPLEECFNIS